MIISIILIVFTTYFLFVAAKFNQSLAFELSYNSCVSKDSIKYFEEQGYEFKNFYDLVDDK